MSWHDIILSLWSKLKSFQSEGVDNKGIFGTKAAHAVNHLQYIFQM